MKLVAVETVTGKRYPVSNAEFDLDGNIKRVDSFKIDCDNIIITHIDIPAEATLHISTDMTDKHGREILVGDSLRNNAESVSCPVYYTGTGFLVPMGSMDFLLTTELAATMEVVE